MRPKIEDADAMSRVPDALEGVQSHESILREIQDYLLRGVSPLGYSPYDVAEARAMLNRPERPIPDERKEDYDFIASRIQGGRRLVTFRDDRQIRTEEGGIYSKEGESYIRSSIESWLPGSHKHDKDEVLEKLKDRTIVDRDEFLSPPWLIAFENKVYDARSGEFREYEDEDRFLSKLKVKIDPKLTLPKEAVRFLESAQPNPDIRRKLWDHFASCLDRRPLKRRALMLEGERDTGKSTFLGLERAFLGAENVSNLSLQEICYSPWAGAQVYDKALNAHADLSDAQLKDLGKFKCLTGGDALTVQFKRGQLFEVLPYVKLHFACNMSPSLRDTGDMAFFSRWDLVDWPNQVNGSSRDAKLLEKMSSPEELSALAWLLCGVLRRQFSDGFMFDPSPEEVRDKWLGKVEPVRGWLLSHVKRDVNSWVKRADLYDSWDAYRLEKILSRVTETRFNELVEQVLGGQKATIKYNGKTLKVFRNIQVPEVTGNIPLLMYTKSSIEDSTGGNR